MCAVKITVHVHCNKKYVLGWCRWGGRSHVLCRWAHGWECQNETLPFGNCWRCGSHGVSNVRDLSCVVLTFRALPFLHKVKFKNISLAKTYAPCFFFCSGEDQVLGLGKETVAQLLNQFCWPVSQRPLEIVSKQTMATKIDMVSNISLISRLWA